MTAPDHTSILFKSHLARTGVSIHDLSEKYFHFGPDKGYNCNCYKGLLATGEGITLTGYEGSPFYWKLRVFYPIDLFIKSFDDAGPVFDSQ